MTAFYFSWSRWDKDFANISFSTQDKSIIHDFQSFSRLCLLPDRRFEAMCKSLRLLTTSGTKPSCSLCNLHEIYPWIPDKITSPRGHTMWAVTFAWLLSDLLFTFSMRYSKILTLRFYSPSAKCSTEWTAERTIYVFDEWVYIDSLFALFLQMVFLRVGIEKITQCGASKGIDGNIL